MHSQFLVKHDSKDHIKLTKFRPSEIEGPSTLLTLCRVLYPKTHPPFIEDLEESVLEATDEVSRNVVFDVHPNYKNIHQKISNIRQIHLNTMSCIGGVVTRWSGAFRQLNCNKCGMILGPFFQNSCSELKVRSCPKCGPFTVNIEQTIHMNYLKRSPGNVPAGLLPRYKEVMLLKDLIDCAWPGEEIVTGINSNINFDLSMNTKNGFPDFTTVVEANYITKKQDHFSAYKLTQQDKEEIKKLSKDPRIEERIVKSIAPSIFGHEDIKTAVALAMLGGQEKNVEGKLMLHGDIKVLLMADPGAAKSQFLKYVEKTGQRAVYTTGKEASVVGLNAAVHKDAVTWAWTLEGGALVLADKGICLIDESGKMNDQDKVSIHEDMEQQSISISKAGIVTSLQPRCSVIAAANPIGGSLQFCFERKALTERPSRPNEPVTVSREKGDQDLTKTYQPFVLSKSDRMRFYEIYYKAERSRYQRVHFDPQVDIRPWTIAGHDHEIGWLLLVQNTQVVYYSVVNGGWSSIDELPIDVGTTPTVHGCFSHQPCDVRNITMITYMLKGRLLIFKHSGETRRWRMDPIEINEYQIERAHIKTSSSFLWVDYERSRFNVIANWATPRLHYRRMSLSSDFINVDFSSAIMRDSRIIFVTFNNHNGALRVYNFRLVEDGGNDRLSLRANLNGSNLYVTYGGTGFGFSPRSGPRNVIYFSGLHYTHCTSVTYDGNTLVCTHEKACFGRAEQDNELDFCCCSNVWFNLSSGIFFDRAATWLYSV